MRIEIKHQHSPTAAAEQETPLLLKTPGNWVNKDCCEWGFEEKPCVNTALTDADKRALQRVYAKIKRSPNMERAAKVKALKAQGKGLAETAALLKHVNDGVGYGYDSVKRDYNALPR